MNNQLSFKELKDRVSIMQVAMDLGYVLDKSKGNSQPSFVLMSGGKEETDRIYIKIPIIHLYRGIGDAEVILKVMLYHL